MTEDFFAAPDGSTPNVPAIVRSRLRGSYSCSLTAPLRANRETTTAPTAGGLDAGSAGAGRLPPSNSTTSSPSSANAFELVIFGTHSRSQASARRSPVGSSPGQSAGSRPSWQVSGTT